MANIITLLKQFIHVTRLAAVPSFIYRCFEYGHWNYTYDSYRRRYHLSPSFTFNGNDILFYGSGEIIIGDNSYFGRDSSINAAEGCRVIIGKNCRISHNVKIYTTTWDVKHYLAGKLVDKKGDVTIKDNCWIGTNAFIGPGVTIGMNAIIGANVVVTHDVDDYTVVKATSSKIQKKNQ